MENGNGCFFFPSFFVKIFEPSVEEGKPGNQCYLYGKQFGLILKSSNQNSLSSTLNSHFSQSINDLGTFCMLNYLNILICYNLLVTVDGLVHKQRGQGI